MKRLVVLLALVSVLVSGMSAQIMFGVSGALPMDQEKTAAEIQKAFEEGSGVWYGFFGELALGKLGFGLSGNFMAPYVVDVVNDYSYVDLDIAGYVSYHLFGARTFLDPFGELGVGYVGVDYAFDDKSQSAKELSNPDDPLAASLYWYGAVGVGVNLGSIGVFGKFAYNNAMPNKLQGANGNDIPFYGPFNWDTFDFDQYVPKFRFTLGAKLIL